MKSLKIVMLFFSISSLTFAQEIIKMQVKENTVPCTGVAPMDCMQVKIGKDKNWTNFYSNIEDFNYQPGYTYKLKVIKTKKTGKLPADVSAYDYKLEKVVCKKKVKNKETTTTQSTTFLNKKMILTKLNGKEITNGKAYATFNSANNSVYGKSGCNNFSASFSLNSDKVSLQSGISTQMACDTESMQLENDFLEMLHSKKYTVAVINDKVQFTDVAKKEVVMEFTIPTAKDAWTFIDGKKWKLFQMNHVGKDFDNAFISFDVAGNKVMGNTGCNNFSGTFTTVDEEIVFSPLRTTRMACGDEEKAKTESEIITNIGEQKVRFDVAEQTLNFYKDNKLVMMWGWVQE